MLGAADIQSIVSSGEGYNTEFKVSVPSSVKEITQEICAFANAAGGTLLVGVSDNNTIIGAAVSNSKRSSIQNSLNAIDPHISCSLYSVKIKEKEVWVIEVSSGPNKPYILSGVIYVRQGPNTQKLTSVEQIHHFFQRKNRIYFDESPCSSFKLGTHLDLDYFDYFKEAAGLSSQIGNSQIIDNLRLLTDEGVIKSGAVLFFGKDPDCFFEKATIRCVMFEGVGKTQIIDSRLYTGPLMNQYRQSMTWIKSKLNIRYKIQGAGPRAELWEIPEISFKEAIINALAHRDYYDKGGSITIEIFADRVEITNPGGLVSTIPPEDFGTKSHSRNPLIFGLFERIHMVEQIGSGISRIRDSIAAYKLPAPVFKMKGLFTVIFQRPLVLLSKNKRPKRDDSRRAEILKAIIEDPKITIVLIAKKVGISSKGVEYHLSKMKKEGLIERSGSTKDGHWQINPSKS